MDSPIIKLYFFLFAFFHNHLVAHRQNRTTRRTTQTYILFGFNQEFQKIKISKMLVGVGGGRRVNNTNCFH